MKIINFTNSNNIIFVHAICHNSFTFRSILIIYDIFVNCNWVVSRWQKYRTHLHTNNT